MQPETYKCYCEPRTEYEPGYTCGPCRDAAKRETGQLTPQKTLRDLLDEFCTLRDTLEGLDEDAPDRQYLEALYAQAGSKYTDKGDRFAAFLKALEREDKSYGEDIQRFQRRRKAVQHLAENRRAYARDAMQQNGISQIKGKAYTITLMPGKQRLEIDVSKLPGEYFNVIPQQIIPEQYVPDEDAIAKDLKHGIEIPGARLVDGDPFIQVR